MPDAAPESIDQRFLCLLTAHVPSSLLGALHCRENHMLLLDDYNHGPTAPYKSWVLLEKPADIEVVA